MSIHAMELVWKLSKAKSGDLLVALALADFSNEKGLAWPSISTVAKKARLSTRQVKRALQRLVQLGELTILPNQGPHGVNNYRLILGDKLSLGVTFTTGGGDKSCKKWPGGGDISCKKGVYDLSPNPLSGDPKEKKENRHLHKKETATTNNSLSFFSVEEVRTAWNQIPGVKPCKSLTGVLLARIASLAKHHDHTWWETLFAEIGASKFLTGKISRGEKLPFQATLDWVTETEHVAKILAGNYSDVSIPRPKNKCAL